MNIIKCRSHVIISPCNRLYKWLVFINVLKKAAKVATKNPSAPRLLRISKFIDDCLKSREFLVLIYCQAHWQHPRLINSLSMRMLTIFQLILTPVSFLDPSQIHLAKSCLESYVISVHSMCIQTRYSLQTWFNPVGLHLYSCSDYLNHGFQLHGRAILATILLTHH